jgi:chromosomal replication initiator protein
MTLTATQDINTQDVQIWQQVQNKLKSEFGEGTYKSWLSKLDFVSSEANKLVLIAPTKFMREWIVTHYVESIKNSWRSFNPSIEDLEINVASPNNQIVSSANSSNSNLTISEDKKNSDIDNFYQNYSLTSVLDERFTFDNFVVGAPNEFAYAAAKSVAENSSTTAKTNPLFLYGGVGLGKTHLMHAIAWQVYNSNKNRKVMYISAEKFMYQFVRALRNKEIMSFKEHFRSVDVLMIDDVQFICGKDSTQEEFFHTFNALIDNNCQIVISCDRSPSDLDGMEERIKSRLGWGLVADVHSTTYELRLGILLSKIEQMKVSVPKSVLEFLATKITSNVRELEGALNKVVALSKLVGREINLENTHEILRDLLRSSERVISIEEIQKKVAEHYNIKMSDMSSIKKTRSIARPRQVAMYLSKNLTNKSFMEIGRKFGGKDHTTIMHAIKTIEGLKSTDNEIAEDLHILSKILQA